MKTHIILILTCTLLLLFGCREHLSDDDNFQEDFNWNGTKVPANFKWSATKDVNLIVNIEPLQENFNMMRKLVYLMDQNGEVLRKKLVRNSKVEFQTKLGANLQDLYLFCPNTGNIQALHTSEGNVSFPMAWSSIKMDNIGIELHEDFAAFKTPFK